MRRGEVYWADLPDPAGRRPVVVVGRGESLRRLPRVLVAPVSSNVRRLDSEVPVGTAEGIPHPSTVQCDALQSIHRQEIETHPIGSLDSVKMRLLDDALRYALDVRCPPA